MWHHLQYILHCKHMWNCLQCLYRLHQRDSCQSWQHTHLHLKGQKLDIWPKEDWTNLVSHYSAKKAVERFNKNIYCHWASKEWAILKNSFNAQALYTILIFLESRLLYLKMPFVLKAGVLKDRKCNSSPEHNWVWSSTYLTYGHLHN